jgi:hypothetical protein
MLTSSKAVLTKDAFQMNPDKYTFFSQYDEETGFIEKGFYMPNDIFSALGSPTTITLTIEPGDKLNED